MPSVRICARVLVRVCACPGYIVLLYKCSQGLAIDCGNVWNGENRNKQTNDRKKSCGGNSCRFCVFCTLRSKLNASGATHSCGTPLSSYCLTEDWHPCWMHPRHVSAYTLIQSFTISYIRLRRCHTFPLRFHSLYSSENGRSGWLLLLLWISYYYYCYFVGS